MSDEPVIAVVGSVNMDLSVRTPRVPSRGENLLARGLSVGLGGKGANPAVAISRMGGYASFVGCVGADGFGLQAQEALESEDVDISGLCVAPGVPTGVALIMVDDEGQNTILVAIGANQMLRATEVEAALLRLDPQPDAVMVNFEVPETCVAAAVAYGEQRDIRTVVDAGPPRGYPPSCFARASVLSPNREEAEHMLGFCLCDPKAIERAAHALQDLGPRSVVLKLGGDGAYVLSEGIAEFVPGYRVEVVDTTGAGDAFTAALTLGLARGDDLVAATRFACAAGAVTVTRVGALDAMPDAREIATLMNE